MLSDALRLFSSYEKLMLASTIRSSQPDSQALWKPLLSSSVEVLRALGNVLHMVVHSRSTLKEPLKILRGVDSILHSVMACVFSIPAFTEKIKTVNKVPHPCSQKCDLTSALDIFFGTLALDLVIPIVKSFGRLSQEIYLSALRGTRHQKQISHSDGVSGVLPPCLDIRPDLSAMVKGILSTMYSYDGEIIVSSSGEFSEAVLLSALAEISRTWNLSVPIDKSADVQFGLQSLLVAKPNRSERVHRLVRKDVLWYLCIVVHDCLSIKAPSRIDVVGNPTIHTTTLIRTRLEDAISELLVHCTSNLHSEFGTAGTPAMYEVEKGMLMGIVERAYLGDLLKSGL
ncbi:hypothetical protein EW145_g169 [Phellinidium pouzarii]|uniref:Uncharacterized protein n=1 Tax=Phellinidium pouzarii TaxID=167371 RepID=A0A4S4LL60_9AGAM|nr:hypothetical protein EW145_g169 [Phellinidium pouzarii]